VGPRNHVLGGFQGLPGEVAILCVLSAMRPFVAIL